MIYSIQTTSDKINKIDVKSTQQIKLNNIKAFRQTSNDKLKKGE